MCAPIKTSIGTVKSATQLQGSWLALRRFVTGTFLSFAAVLIAVLVKHDASIIHRGSVGLSVPGVIDHESFEAVVDNYVYMHNALRNDLEAMIKLSSQEESIAVRFAEWKDTLERHSRVEDEIMIPALVARIKKIPGGSEDSLTPAILSGLSHQQVESLVANVEVNEKRGGAENRTVALIELRAALEEHLKEEEEEVMPKMLHYFSYRELWALDSFIINPKLDYCPPDVLVRITVWWFRNIGLAEGWRLLKNFVRAGNQPPMSTEKWEELRADLPALREVPIEDIMA